MPLSQASLLGDETTKVTARDSASALPKVKSNAVIRESGSTIVTITRADGSFRDLGGGRCDSRIGKHDCHNHKDGSFLQDGQCAVPGNNSAPKKTAPPGGRSGDLTKLFNSDQLLLVAASWACLLLIQLPLQLQQLP